jgi:hypothetical protein
MSLNDEFKSSLLEKLLSSMAGISGFFAGLGGHGSMF